jgi:uncharacterized protein
MKTGSLRMVNPDGTLSFTYSGYTGIQNGDPDGLALVDSGNNVIQFLSYEGTFTAVGGPAEGLLSTDIGVAEKPLDTSVPIGYSLQLVGIDGKVLGVDGTSYEDFTWSGPAPASFGLVNAGQTPVPASILLLCSGLLGLGAMGWRRRKKE